MYAVGSDVVIERVGVKETMMNNELKFFQVERDGPVIIWKFHNPPKNLLAAEVWEDMNKLVKDFEEDQDLRVAILTSALPDVFIQHADVTRILQFSDMLRDSSDGSLPQAVSPRATRPDFSKIPKPIVCVINGWVSGGGCELSLECDFRFMSRNATIGLPEVNVGILPPTGILRMPRLLGVAKALELIMLGTIIDSEEAARIGLVHRVCEPDKLMVEAVEFAKELAARPPLAIAHIKRLIYEGTEMPIEEGPALTRQLFMELARSEDAYRLMKEYVARGQDREWILEQFGTSKSKQVYRDENH
jgi:enoyl-CoA hydratase